LDSTRRESEWKPSNTLATKNISPSAPRRGVLPNGLYGEAPPERGTFFRLQAGLQVYIHKFRYMKG